MKRVISKVYLAIILIFLYLPIFVLMVLSFNESKSMFAWEGFSLKWYKEMFTSTQILSAVWNTFSIAIMAAVISTVIGVMACVGINSMGRKSRTVLLGLNQIPLLNADIVMGISLMLSFIGLGLYLNWGTVLLAHVTFCIPYVILSVLPKLKQIGSMHYEAALDLGATPQYAFRKVVIPELRPAIVSGFLLAFTMSVDDFVVTHFTRGAGINTISTLIYSQLKVGIRPTLFAISTVIFVVVLIVLIVVNVAGNKSAEESPVYDVPHA